MCVCIGGEYFSFILFGGKVMEVGKEVGREVGKGGGKGGGKEGGKGGGKGGNKKSGFPSWAALTTPSAAGGIRT